MIDDRLQLPPVMTAQEVAELLRIARSTVRTMAKDGRLVPVRGLRVVRITGASVERLIAGQPRADTQVRSDAEHLEQSND